MIRTVPSYPITWLFDFDPNGGGGVPGAPQYAFGINLTTNSFWFHLGALPTDWIKIGSGSGGGVLGVNLEDEGIAVAGNPHATVNFVGAGVTVTDAAGVGTVTIPGATSGINLEDEGIAVAGNPHLTVNFVGAGVTVTDAAGVGIVTIPGGGTGPQVFSYTVLGTEPVLSELVIPIPVATADVSYAVVATCQGCAGIVAMDVPNATKATTHFTVIATGDFAAGDVISFFLSPLT